MDSSQEPIDTGELLEKLTGRFSLEELRTLAFQVGVDWDDLEGTAKTSKTRELIAYLDRQGRLNELVTAAARPDATGSRMPAEAQPGGAQATFGRTAIVNVFQQAAPRPVDKDEVAAAQRRLPGIGHQPARPLERDAGGEGAAAGGVVAQ